MPIHRPRNAKERARRKDAYAHLLYTTNRSRKSFLVTYYPWMVCALAAFFYFYEVLLRMSPSVMVKDLMATFAISSAGVGHMAAYYGYAYTPMQIPAGMLMDKYGPRKVLSFAVTTCAIGAIVFSSCEMLAFAKFGRFLIGLGSAFAFVGILKLATIWLPADKFAMVTGLTTTLGMCGAAFGQILLASYIEMMGWEKSIYYAGLGGLLLLPITWLLVRDAPKKIQARTVMQVELSFSHLLMVVREIFKNKQIWLIGVVGSLIYLPVLAFAEFWAPTYIELKYSVSKEMSALITSMILIGWAIGSPISGYLSDKFKTRKIPLLFSSAAGFVFFSMALFLPLTAFQLGVVLFIFGFCISSQVLVFSLGCEHNPPSVSGTAVAVTNFLVMVGGSVLMPLVGDIIDFFWVREGLMQHNLDGTRLYSVANFDYAFVLFPLCFVLSFIFCLFIKETHCKQLVQDKNI